MKSASGMYKYTTFFHLRSMTTAYAPSIRFR